MKFNIRKYFIYLMDCFNDIEFWYLSLIYVLILIPYAIYYNMNGIFILFIQLFLILYIINYMKGFIKFNRKSKINKEEDKIIKKRMKKLEMNKK